MSFEIGQKVVCVDDRFEDWVLKLYTALPKKAAVYVVRDVRIGATFEKGQRKGAVSILLVGLVNPCAPGSNSSMAERGFNSDRFRSLDSLRSANTEINAESQRTQRPQREVVLTTECEPHEQTG